MDFAFALRHYLFPGYSNNHKARILHSSSLMLLSLFLIAYQVLLQVFPLTNLKILGYAANIHPDEIIRLTNEKRKEAGISSLTYNAQLSQAAKLKAEHMIQYDYWAHVAPDGTEPWKFFTDQGYKYRYAGENLARDFSNPQDAIDAWMASPSHKENMLSSKYKEIGVGVAEGDMNGVDTTIIVQLFGTQLIDTTPQLPVAQAKPQTELLTPTVTVIPTNSPTITPTPPAFIAAISPKPPEINIIEEQKPASNKANSFELFLSPFTSTRSVALATTGILMVVMVIDGIIVSRRKIARIGGRTFAHLAFLGMILALLLIAKAGSIL